MKFIFILLLFSCGNEKGSYRCLTKDEALTICLSKEISAGLDLHNAKLRCEPYYRIEGCYE